MTFGAGRTWSVSRSVGGDVHLRGLIEISNHCVRLCGYCGLRVDNAHCPATA